MNDTPGTGRGTRVRSPEQDWSHVHETMLMLELAAGQIDAAMTESSSSVDVLTGTFTAMANCLQAMRAEVDALPDEGEAGRRKAALQATGGEVDGMAHQAIIAFQFYDKLAQRLDHVCQSLGGLSELVRDTGRLYDPQQWAALQERIRSKYTMAEERGMFDAVMAGATVQDALRDYMATRMAQVEESDGGIELF